ncbi:MAG: HEPN domain-containing protein [Actinomycetota bacterium]|nr:HEPN domain-containing protein [Actinomycetota bacterium]
MTFCFHIRCILGATVGLASQEPQWILATKDDHGEDVVLRPAHGNTLGNARQLVIEGSSYDAEPAALEAGQRWMARVQTAFACMAIGADFGDRTPNVMWIDAGLHGLTVFECDPPPKFVGVGPATASVSKSGPAVLRALRTAAVMSATMTPQQQLAYDLFSASFNEANVDARFVTLMMAVEALLPEVKHQELVLEHLERLVAIARKAELPDEEQRSLLGTLRRLKYQSISQLGRQISKSLGNRTYMGDRPGESESATTFFTRCYKMRSALVHGRYPRPTCEAVTVRVEHLKHFMADLLAGQLRDFNPHL